ncbi:RNA pseudouridine synthase [Fulvivirgaceae bacterium PWU4]|uniref:RNA pseudouridine synthase n=1 Tax=Chryseosolibacter histidini TaxID=2782349 RepID=A0AAP2DNP6_9BACT|nr:pseudouridine synthase [Chryseosolibacter histidini]MBT1698217.1 RNA pseudouridine synthase [Chryseosolibacter histidini]
MEEFNQQRVKRPKVRFEDIIRFEDHDYVVVSKPAFLSTLEDRHERVNLLALAREYTPDAQACHRLDKDTSGVLAIAKHPEAYRHLSIQFEKRQVEKVYHAVVDGIHNFSNLLVDAPILKQNDGVVKISRREGKDAQTYFTSLRSYRLHTLMECRPVTGRMHQIRIHLASQGASITGDDTYGGKPFLLSELKRGFNLKKGTEEETFMKRMALHAFSLEFEDLSGKRLKIEAPYPKDMQALIRQLEMNS